jgi:hypothetical protein
MKIYLVCENVDLGYNVVKAFKEQCRAFNHAKHLNHLYCKDKITALLKCGYTKEQADLYVKNMNDEFFVDEIDLTE